MSSCWIISYNNASFRIYANNRSNVICFKSLKDAEDFKKKILHHFNFNEVVCIVNHNKQILMLMNSHRTLLQNTTPHKAECIKIENSMNAPNLIKMNKKITNKLYLTDYEFLSIDGSSLDYEDIMNESKIMHDKCYILSIQGIIVS